MYDSEQFVVIDVVVVFSRSEGFQEVGARVEVTIGVFLHEDAARGGEGGIGHDKEGFGVIREGKYRLFQEGFLDLLEGHFVVDRTLPVGILVCKG